METIIKTGIKEKYYYYLLGHIVLAVVFYYLPIVAALHEAIVILLGLYFSLFRENKNFSVLIVIYIIGAEVLWRMVNTNVYSFLLPYEVCRYAVIAILVFNFFNFNKKIIISPLLLIYIICLIPSTIGILFESDHYFLFRQLKNSLGSQLSLFFLILYFTNRSIGNQEKEKIMNVILGPIVCAMVLSFYHFQILGNSIFFGKSSVGAIALGAGANQFSNTLSFGCVICWISLIHYSHNIKQIILYLVLFISMFVQMLLSFSRSGGISVSLAVISSCLFLLFNKDSNKRFRSLFIIVIVLIIFIKYVFPELIMTTNDAITNRYSRLQTSRYALMDAEIKVWLDNPIYGAGPGFARFKTKDYFGSALQTHSQFTRHLAEYGLMGLIMNLILLFWTIKNIIRAKHNISITVPLFVCCYIIWLSGAMRIVIPNLSYALTFIFLEKEEARLPLN